MQADAFAARPRGPGRSSRNRTPHGSVWSAPCAQRPTRDGTSCVGADPRPHRSKRSSPALGRCPGSSPAPSGRFGGWPLIGQRRRSCFRPLAFKMAEARGFEPPTPCGVTRFQGGPLGQPDRFRGMRILCKFMHVWRGREDLNLRRLAALPAFEAGPSTSRTIPTRRRRDDSNVRRLSALLALQASPSASRTVSIIGRLVWWSVRPWSTGLVVLGLLV